MSINDDGFFGKVVSGVRDALVSDGYALIELPVQQWAVRYSLTHEASGGGLALAFGPVRGLEREFCIPYEVVRESGAVAGEVNIPSEAIPDEAAVAFVKLIEPMLDNQLPLMARTEVNVGVGLQSIDEAEVLHKQQNIGR